MNSSGRNLTITAMITAVICIIGPVTVPIGPVPLSLVSLGIYLAVILLGKKRAIVSVLLYLFIGFSGIPVFSGFSSGPGKLLGPTGGYLAGYLFLVWIAGSCMEAEKKKVKRKGRMFISLLLGTVVMYIPGAVWMAVQTGLEIKTAIFSGVLLFIPGDLLKMHIAVLLGERLKRWLNSGFFTKF